MLSINYNNNFISYELIYYLTQSNIKYVSIFLYMYTYKHIYLKLSLFTHELICEQVIMFELGSLNSWA